jgi:hypothetical protein
MVTILVYTTMTRTTGFGMIILKLTISIGMLQYRLLNGMW